MQYHEDYTSFMEDMINKVYAEKSDSKANRQGKTWFIPHHEVYHPSKAGKIRVVFDCSAEYDGVFVNKRLLSCPDLTNQVVEILGKFREEYVAICQILRPCFTKCLWQINIEVYLAFFGGKMEILKDNLKSTI